MIMGRANCRCCFTCKYSFDCDSPPGAINMEVADHSLFWICLFGISGIYLEFGISHMVIGAT